MAKNWMKNVKGEFKYLFNWMDKNGMYCGFNDVWAPNVAVARKRAKAMESPAREFVSENHPEWGSYKGMYANPKSFRKATVAASMEMDRIGYMITM